MGYGELSYPHSLLPGGNTGVRTKCFICEAWGLVQHMGLDEAAARVGSFSAGQKEILSSVQLKAMQKDKVQGKG